MSALESKKVELFFLHGRPSSGKSYQAELLVAERPNALHISTGEMVHRRAIANQEGDTNYQNLIQSGELIPDPMVGSMVFNELLYQIYQGINFFVFTGYPRTLGQLVEINAAAERLRMKRGLDVIDKHVYLYIDEAASRRRTENKGLALATQGIPVYSPEAAETRLRIFRESTRPMLEKLRFQDRLATVNAKVDPKLCHNTILWALGLKQPATNSANL